MLTPFSEAAERNKQPILEKLRLLLSSCQSVLEIGSGTGQHAIFFAAALPHLIWRPTELPEKMAMLSILCRSQSPDNLAAPMSLDIDDTVWPAIRVDAVFTANTLHIVHWPQACRLFARVGELLPVHGLFCTYGPFNVNGCFTSESNAQFDWLLKNHDPQSGIRDIADLQQQAEKCGLLLQENYAMPANNHLLVWRKH